MIGTGISQRWLVIAITTLFILLAAISRPEIISIENISQVLRQISVVGIIAVGVMFVIITGRLDLSVGSLLSLSVVMGISIHDKFGPLACILLMLGIGVLVGCINGFLIAYLRLNSLITTLGMLSVLQGVTYVLADGKSPLIAHPEDTWFSVFGRSYFFSVPVPVVVWALVALVAAGILARTNFGRRLYAVGGNETASVYSSVNARAVVFSAYVVSAVLTSVGAIVLASRVMAGQNNTGAGYEVTVLSAIVLGGASLTGGSGTVVNAVLGVAVIGFINNALILCGLPYYMQWIISWLVIVMTIWLGLVSERGRLLI